MKKTKQLIAITAIALFMQGCSIKMGSFSNISTKSIDFSKKYTKGAKKVRGEDVSHMYVIIPIPLRTYIDEAVNDALNKSCAEYLTDVTVKRKWWYIPYIYGKSWFEVEGYPWFKEGETDCRDDKKGDKK